MKKIIMMILGLLWLENISFASSSLSYLTSVMDIPEINQNGFHLSEDIYEKYQLLVYGSPEMIKEGQRWKDVQEGKWSNGSRIGEYWILGQNYQGVEVHNPEFPYDYDSGMNPLYWPYVEIAGGLESWNDITRYQTEKQKEYMLSTNLSRNGTTYDFNASMIGLSKTRVENVATWKTNGTIEVRKRDANGVYWSATFSIRPMAADASLEPKLDFKEGETYAFQDEEDSIEVFINFGALITNLSGYAEPKDIKTIRAELFVEETSVCFAQMSQETQIEGVYHLVISKSLLGTLSQKQIPIKCVATLETCFGGDIPLYAECERMITVYSGDMLPEEEEIVTINQNQIVKDTFERNMQGNLPEIISIQMKRVSTNNAGKETKVNLLQAKKTQTNFIMAGQVIEIEVQVKDTGSVTLEIAGDKSITNLDQLTKKFEWEEPRQRGVKTRFDSLKAMERAYHMPTPLTFDHRWGEVSYYKMTYVIPYKTVQTLHSWNTLREKNKNAFEINEKELFSRINPPYEIVIKATSAVGTVTKRTKLDVFEAWNTIYNRDISRYVL